MKARDSELGVRAADDGRRAEMRLGTAACAHLVDSLQGKADNEGFEVGNKIASVLTALRISRGSFESTIVNNNSDPLFTFLLLILCTLDICTNRLRVGTGVKLRALQVL